MSSEKLSAGHGEGKLKREIKSRHLSMIAVGGSIGTGLFFASGNAVSSIGPGVHCSASELWDSSYT